MKIITKRMVVATLILGGLGVIGIGVRWEMKRRAKEQAKEQARKEREARYEETLRAFSEVLKPGMSRREVEDYLRKQGRTVMHMCCVNRTERIGPEWDDLTLIGKEEASWYCAEYNAYMAFEFTNDRQGESDSGVHDSDTLKAISIYHWAENCL